MDHPQMKKRIITIVILCYLPLGCASLSGKARMEEFGRTMDAYEIAMRTSNFNAICRYVDSSAMSREDCLKRFGPIKLVDYRLTDMQVSPDRMKVHQEIEVGYYFLDRYVLQKIRYRQTWEYEKDRELWLLKNGPPAFK
jgi:hypothetical protein